MPGHDFSALRCAIKERLCGELGGTRRMIPGTVEDGVFDGQPLGAEQAAALQVPRFGVAIDGFRNHGATPISNIGSSRLVEIDITITFSYRLPITVDHDARDEVLAQMATDGDAAVQSLSYPDALLYTAAGQNTSLVGGILWGPRGSTGMPQWQRIDEDWDAGIAHSEITASGVIDVAQTVSAASASGGDDVSTTSAEIDIYVRDVDGTDDNDGLSPGAPLKTWQAAVDYLNTFAVHNHTVRVHLGPHSGDGYAWATEPIKPRLLRKNLYIYGDGGGGATDGFVVLKATSGAGSGSGIALVKTTGMSANEYRGYTIEILTGDAAGDRRTIKETTTTNIVPIMEFSAAVQAGDSFRVVKPEVVLIPPTTIGNATGAPLCIGCGSASDSLWDGSQYDSSVWFINLSITTPSDANRYLGVVESDVVFFGVDTGDENNNRPIHWFPQSRLRSGFESWGAAYSAPNSVDDLGTTFETSWVGWGYAIHATFSGVVFGSGDYALMIVSPGMDTRGNCRMTIYAGNLYGYPIVNSAALKQDIYGVDAAVPGTVIADYTESIGITIDGQGSGAKQHAIEIQAGTLHIYGNANTVIQSGSNASARAIEVDFGGIMYCTGAPQLNSSGIGLVTKDGGRAYTAVELSGTNTTADFSEDGGSTLRSFAALTSGSSFAYEASIIARD